MLSLLSLVLGLGSLPAAADRVHPPPDTIRSIEGAANGFSIDYGGQRSVYPPTLSQVIAECFGYESYIVQVRCRVQVRTECRMLTEAQQALRWAKPGRRP